MISSSSSSSSRQENLGCGTFGSVVADPSDASKVIKRIHFSLQKDIYLEPWVLREIYTLCLPPDPHLVRMDRLLSLDTRKCEIVMPRAICDLDSKLDSLGNDLTLKQVGCICWQLFSALETLHGYDLVHYDVKPDNVLVFSWPQPQIKLADFGLVLYRHAPVHPKPQFLVTPIYRPPDQFPTTTSTTTRGDAFRLDPAADIYSAGVIMLQLLAVWASRGRVKPTFTDCGTVVPEMVCSKTPHLWKLKKSRRCKKRTALALWKSLFVIASRAASVDQSQRPDAKSVKMDIAQVLNMQSPIMRQVAQSSSPVAKVFARLGLQVAKIGTAADAFVSCQVLTLMDKIPDLVREMKVSDALKQEACMALAAWIPFDEQEQVVDESRSDVSQTLQRLVSFYNWLLLC